MFATAASLSPAAHQPRNCGGRSKKTYAPSGPIKRPSPRAAEWHGDVEAAPPPTANAKPRAQPAAAHSRRAAELCTLAMAGEATANRSTDSRTVEVQRGVQSHEPFAPSTRCGQARLRFRRPKSVVRGKSARRPGQEGIYLGRSTPQADTVRT